MTPARPVERFTADGAWVDPVAERAEESSAVTTRPSSPGRWWSGSTSRRRRSARW